MYSFNRTTMDGENIQKYSQPLRMRGKLADDADFPTHTHSRIEQCSHTSQMDWDEGSRSPHRDCSESYRDVGLNLAKLGVDNLRLKNVSKFEMPMSASEINGPFADDINKRQAAKRVVQPVMTKDESTVPQEDLLGFHHKKRLLKRTMTEAPDKEDPPYTLDPAMLKATTCLIQQLKTNSYSGGNICLSYNTAKFSHFANLKELEGFRVSSGTFGDVMKGRDTETEEILIKKVVRKNAKGVFSFERNEVEVPLQFPEAQNIARFYGLVVDCGQLIFIMEDAGISLRQLISSPDCKMLNSPLAIEKVTLDVMSAVSVLAKQGITHCDIKPENICLNLRTWVAKLVDFGSCKTLQNPMTYSGITPEYLDPKVNKYLYEANFLRNRDFPVHRLDEKDDVYSAGMSSLFLIMKCHPIIQHMTGLKDYPVSDHAVAIKLRLTVIKQISEMNDESLMKLLDIPMSAIMKELLFRVLELNRTDRLTSKQAVLFLQEKLNLNVQPPSKLPKQEQQPHQPKLDGVSRFANVHEKNMDLDVGQTHETGKILGIAYKEKAFPGLPGMIHVPAKLTASTQSGQAESSFYSAVQCKAEPVKQDTGFLSVMGAKLRHYPLEVPQEDKMMTREEKVMTQDEKVMTQDEKVMTQDERDSREYAELVDYLNVTLVASLPKRNLPVRLNSPKIQPQNHSPDAYYANPQAELPQNLRAGNCFNSGPVQNGPQRVPNGAFQGIFGSYFNQRGDRYVDPTFVANGNIPDIDALMRPSDEQARPKIKGARRCSGNQE